MEVVALSIVTVTRPDTTLAVTRGAARLLTEMAYAPPTGGGPT
jgi:hypothetical protein